MNGTAFARIAPEIDDDATRRRFLQLIAAIGLLAGCAAPDSPPETAPSADPETRPVDHQFGRAEVPLDPRRVFTIEGRNDLEVALALGLSLVGTGTIGTEGRSEFPEAVNSVLLEGLTVVFSPGGEPNLEAIADLRPDLIIGIDYSVEEKYDQLSQIAATVPIAQNEDWKTVLTGMGTALGRDAQAAERIAEFDTRRDAVRARHRDRIASASVVIVSVDGTQVAGADTGLMNQVLADLGGRHLLAGEYAVSFENLDQIDADLIVLRTYDDEDDLKAGPLWQRLRAVTAGHVLEVPGPATNIGSSFSATLCLDALDRGYALLA